ncbi:nucleoporin protein Ndc1-Nup [Lophiotrema nucula]|uniref:Nucleoporin protein Ndc1-Nup n=1 Tax=Lophiotrema nucula TaxID=690887 RepID=A0A6A5ZEY8_9PLEO|nr:nucleoporin protein Ndc1-Nup [Lophiotrema nucula]
MPPPATRPYRDFLMPSLHRRFVKAISWSTLLCYIISVWMGQWTHWIWSWFPIGPVGIRTAFLCISVLLLLIPRTAQYHAGERNTTSPGETAWKYTFRKATFVTLAAYMCSAWLYCEIYIASRPYKNRLGFTDPGKLHERIRLNERPLFLRFLFLSVAVIQSGYHLWKDYDRIQLGAVKPKQDKREGAPASSVKDPKSELFNQKRLTTSVFGSLNTALVAFVAGFFVYYGGLRYLLWEWHARIARFYFTFGKSAKPTGVSPFVELLAMFASEGPLLAFLWSFVNAAFDLYMAQEPLKAGQPLTSDSKDPNGSLLNGMKSKKEQVKNVAFWELALITDRFEDRRKTIYGELDRKKGPTYKQVLELCVAEVNAITSRIDAVNPNYKPEAKDGKPAPPPRIELVPRISQPLKDGKIAGPGRPPTSTLEMIGQTATQLAKPLSSPQNAQNSNARKMIQAGQGKLIEGAHQAESQWEVYKHQFASSPIGWPLRQSLRRKANTVINGAPYSRQSIVINAVTTLTNLAVSSLKEDEYGQFQKGVPNIVKAFTEAIKKIETYMTGLEVHWTDVDTLALPEADRKKVPEVDEVVAVLRAGLEKVLGGFNEYLVPLGMSRLDIQEAKKLISRPSASPAL